MGFKIPKEVERQGYSHAVGDAMKYAKIVGYGMQGSGKTYTSMLIAWGICEYLRENGLLKGVITDDDGKPVPAIAFNDTENGAIPFQEPTLERGIYFAVAADHAFEQMLTRSATTEKWADVMIYDSATHYLDDVEESFMKKTRSDYLDPGQRARINKDKMKFNRWMLNAQAHVIAIGRLGAEYKNFVDESSGKLDYMQVGTKLRSGPDLGHEATLFMLFEQIRDAEAEEILYKSRDKKARRLAAQVMQQSIVQDVRVTILKDRTFDPKANIQGRQIYNPKWEDFYDWWIAQRPGGTSRIVDTQTDSQSMYTREGRTAGLRSENPDRPREKSEVAALQDEVVAHLEKHWPQGKKAGTIDRAIWASILDAAFNTPSLIRLAQLGEATLHNGLTFLVDLSAEIWDMQQEGRGEEIPQYLAMVKDDRFPKNPLEKIDALSAEKETTAPATTKQTTLMD